MDTNLLSGLTSSGLDPVLSSICGNGIFSGSLSGFTLFRLYNMLNDPEIDVRINEIKTNHMTKTIGDDGILIFDFNEFVEDVIKYMISLPVLPNKHLDDESLSEINDSVKSLSSLVNDTGKIERFRVLLENHSVPLSDLFNNVIEWNLTLELIEKVNEFLLTEMDGLIKREDLVNIKPMRLRFDMNRLIGIAHENENSKNDNNNNDENKVLHVSDDFIVPSKRSVDPLLLATEEKCAVFLSKYADFLSSNGNERVKYANDVEFAEQFSNFLKEYGAVELMSKYQSIYINSNNNIIFPKYRK